MNSWTVLHQIRHRSVMGMGIALACVKLQRRQMAIDFSQRLPTIYGTQTGFEAACATVDGQGMIVCFVSAQVVPILCELLRVSPSSKHLRVLPRVAPFAYDSEAKPLHRPSLTLQVPPICRLQLKICPRCKQ